MNPVLQNGCATRRPIVSDRKAKPRSGRILLGITALRQGKQSMKTALYDVKLTAENANFAKFSTIGAANREEFKSVNKSQPLGMRQFCGFFVFAPLLNLPVFVQSAQLPC